MAAGYDGSIRIDTRIDSRGFNSGVKKISGAIAGMLKATLTGIAAAGAAVPGLVLVLAAIGVILAVVGFIAFKFFDRLTSELAKSLSSTSAYYAQVQSLKTAFDGLRGALAAAGATLLTALAPVLTQIINWLVQAINWVSMFIAALSGAKTVAQYVSGAAEGTAKGTGQAAKNTKELGKAAKGALAAFDQLNVLQMETNDADAAGGGGGGGGNIQLKEVEIDSKILETADKIRSWFSNAWDWVKEKALTAWAWIKQAWKNAPGWFYENVILPVGNFFKNGWETNKRIFSAVLGFLLAGWETNKQLFIDAWQGFIDFLRNGWETNKQIFAGAIDFLLKGWETNKQLFIDTWQGFIDFFKNGWETNKQLAKDAWDRLVEIWNGAGPWFKTNVLDPVGNFFKDGFESNKQRAIDAWEGIKTAWETAKTWFTTNVIDPIKDGFKTALDGIKEKWEAIFGGIKDFTKNTVNTIIDFINAMIRAAANGINAIIGGLNSIKVTIPKWVPIFGGEAWGMNIPTVTAPQIPRLARGAVIPPNAEFAAILGDQRNGRNLEAPESLIRQIIRDEMGHLDGSITIEFAGTMAALIRVLKPYIKKENIRMGGSLITVKGGAG